MIHTFHIRIGSALVWLAIIMAWGMPAVAQSGWKINLVPAYRQPMLASAQLAATTKSYTDTVSCKAYLYNWLTQVQGDGYLSASIDSISFANNICTAVYHAGPRYTYVLLRNNNLMASMNATSWTTKPTTAKQYKQLVKMVLTQMENSGYPFAQVQLTKVNIGDSVVSGELQVQQMQRITIDSVVVIGDARIAPSFIEQYIGIKSGDAYDESIIKQIEKKLSKLNFVKMQKPVQVLFTQSFCRVQIFLTNTRASAADGIVGILPPAIAGGKTTITGEIKLKLTNAFARGENIDIHWRQPSALTQRFNAAAIYPYLLNSPVGVEGRLEIYKKDTTFIDVLRHGGINYILGANNSLKIFAEKRTVSIINTKGLKLLTKLPDYADVSSLLFGLGYTKDATDYRYCPTKGYSMRTTLAAGKRSIEKNAALNAELYDSIKLNTTEYKAEVKGDHYYKLWKRTVCHTGVQAALLQTNFAFASELYRIGGLQTLRGFDEESLIANFYAIGTVELRYLLDANSYFFGFYNHAYYELKTVQKNKSDTPIGFGAGIAFETKAGIFSFNYALGKQQGNPIILRSGKIHFGIVSLF